MAIIKIKDKLYSNAIYFIYGEDDARVLKFIKDRSNYVVEIDITTSAAFALCTNSSNFYLVIRVEVTDKNFLRTLVHECFHITVKVLRQVNVILTNENEEPFAYYMEWLFNECFTRRAKLIARAKQVGKVIINDSGENSRGSPTSGIPIPL